MNDDNHIRLMFWEISEMRELYRKFPEVLIVDRTYCVNSVRMPLYCILVQDGYGNGHVCAYSLIGDATFQ